jgi:aldose 1-epimerase
MELLARSAFQSHVDGGPTDLYTLQGSGGLQVALCNHGARLVRMAVPDGQGDRIDVTLGYDSLEGYLGGQPSMGAFIGRWAGRLRGGRLTLKNGGSLQLPPNGGLHAVHGGPRGSRFRTFQVDEVRPDALHFSHVFRPEDDGVPGVLRVSILYRVLPGYALHVAWRAEAGLEPTLAQFTSHPFFNLAGRGSALDHLLEIRASRFLPLAPDVCPLGITEQVEGGPLDFRAPRTPREAMALLHPQLQVAKGLDHYLVLDREAQPGEPATGWDARLTCPENGHCLWIRSSEPGLQLYAGHGLTGTPPRDLGRGGWLWSPGDGLCLEPMSWPDAPNQPGFPDPWLAPGTSRCGEIVYQFARRGEGRDPEPAASALRA